MTPAEAAAVRALVEALPRCSTSGCTNVAGIDNDISFYCAEHTDEDDHREHDWAAPLAAVEAVLGAPAEPLEVTEAWAKLNALAVRLVEVAAPACPGIFDVRAEAIAFSSGGLPPSRGHCPGCANGAINVDR